MARNRRAKAGGKVVTLAGAEAEARIRGLVVPERYIVKVRVILTGIPEGGVQRWVQEYRARDSGLATPLRARVRVSS